MKRASRSSWRAAASVALGLALAPSLLGALTAAADGSVLGGTAATTPAATPAVRHVVFVGLSGLRWNMISRTGTPELWRLAAAGSVGSLVGYAQQPAACPADGWLTLNAAARAQGPRPCDPLPAVVRDGAGARVPAMARLIAANQRFHESPDWGLLGSLARCATAVGPGAALALASPAGAVASYLPSPGQLSAVVLARCPLTVVDLGTVSAQNQASAAERSLLSALDSSLALLAARLPGGTLLIVTSPGTAAGGRPHLASVVVRGLGFAAGLLGAASTRQPGIVTLTDLTPTMAGWLGRPVPAGTVGARIYREARGDLATTIQTLTGRDTAEQAWLATHGWFFVGYVVADVVAFAAPGLIFWGSDPERRRRRARCWRVAGTLAAAVPLGSYLANLAPWGQLAHPAWWLYGTAAAWSLLLAAVALAGPWRRDALGPFGVLGLLTVAVLGLDVMTGSRLQLEAPFGLSLLVSGRYYGIGNDALGVYCVSVLVAAAWLGLPGTALLTRRSRGAVPDAVAVPVAVSGAVSVASRLRVLAVSLVGLFAVVASGWPGFGAKVGGTIALVPCLLLLIARLAGVRTGWRWAAPVAASGLALFIVVALVSYFFPAAGVSDMGTFAGNLLHGRGGDLLERKAGANVGTLTASGLGWLIPVVAVATALALWRPEALRLRTLSAAFAAAPQVRVLLRLCWLVLLIGWLADDSGVLVPAAALPFAVPLTIAAAASVSAAAGRARYILVPPPPPR